ncbi:hypothetical protein H072_6385 [Dactylellina haptotyla CBS 200.50]|uniref:Uncharacterized protein n=1 Tax=Dactylellina haptotyla (strain CBS 200.50) TaxID=1284197 RepID=S8AA64_DACHA|nr:hypothetical protein H072_6385 [Dactylellina haptotyla CBS 200.50]
MTGIDPAVPTEDSPSNGLILVSSPISEVTSRLQALQLDRLPIFEFSRRLPDIIAKYRQQRMYVSYGSGSSNFLETTVLSPTSLIQPFGFLDWLSEEADTPMPSADEYLTRAPVVDVFERQVESIPFGDIQKLTPKNNKELHTRHADFLTFPLRKVIQSPVLQFENGQIINNMENLAALRLLQSIVYRFSNNLMSREDIRITVYFIFENNLDSIVQCILEQQDESAKAFGQALLRETFSQKIYIRLSKLIFQLKTGLLLSVASEILQSWGPDPEVVDVILENIPETDWAVLLRRYKSGANKENNGGIAQRHAEKKSNL